MNSPTDKFWLAYNCYHEARGEPIAGQIAVCHVVLNRARRRRITPKKVVLRRWQFSWHNGNKFPLVKDRKAWATVKRSVMMCFAERLGGKDLHECDHYFRFDIPKPSWSKGMMLYRQIGAHEFYHRG